MKMTKSFPLGKKTINNSVFRFEVPPNRPEEKTNIFMLGKQGIGKTNLISLFIFYMHRLYLETKGQYGCIPIVFAPTFEYTKLKEKSTLPPGLYPPRAEPQGIEVLNFSFRLANIPKYLEKDITVVKLKFAELTTEDVGTFANLMGQEDALGRVDKLLEELKRNYGEYTINHFLDAVKEDKAVYNSLYYIFKRLRDNGLFDEDLETFDWMTALKQKKPIVFHFGEIEDDFVLQALAGILLRKLYALSNKYINAIYKKVNIQNLGMNAKEKLSDEQNWFLENFVIGLFFEEAHLFFPPTTTKVLRSFPAHKYFKLISMALGRKRNFKFNFLVSQRLELLYKEFRTEYDDLFTGSKVDTTDKKALNEILRQSIPSAKDSIELVALICGNKKFEFTCTNLNKLNIYVTKFQRKEKINPEDSPLTKFKAYVSPCGMY